MAENETALLRRQLADLRAERRARQREQKEHGAKRRTLRPRERHVVLAKTAGRCHICGGSVEGTVWQADHVLAHNAGGARDLDNYLPAHALCNNYRWDYTPEEFQWVLKIGVWARLLMERDNGLGAAMLTRFAAYEKGRKARTKTA
ncbi:MAG TPA: HNH endonuclease signature motif containing protein [Vicinamibacterales bacterium]|nr:HNH endonuclease signature motif containing protein [Vicinamibacterales bacterium]